MNIRRPMKILFLNYEFPPLGGGSGNANDYLFREFAKVPDLEIDLVTSSASGFRVEPFSKNITIHFLDIGKRGNRLSHQGLGDLLRYAARGNKYIGQLLSARGYDLVHAFFGVPCGYMAMKTGLPYIVSLRGSDVPFHNPRFKWLDIILLKRLSRKIWRNARAVAANSAVLKEHALAASPEQQITVITNGVDSALFRPPPWRFRQGLLTLISSGSLKPVKGYDVLMEALRGVPDIRLVLMGEGSEGARLEALAKRNGIECQFTGRLGQAEMVPYLQKADVFVLPSLNEGMSNSVLEAMASGLPLLLTDVGGSRELVCDNGLVVRPGSAEALRGAIEQFLRMGRERDRMGEVSRDMALKMSWKSAADGYVGLYRTYIERGLAGRRVV